MKLTRAQLDAVDSDPQIVELLTLRSRVSSAEDARFLDIELKTARETLRAKMLQQSRQEAAGMQNAAVFNDARTTSASKQPVVGVSGRDSDSLTLPSPNALSEALPFPEEQYVSPVDTVACASPGNIVARNVQELVLELLAGDDSRDSLHTLLCSGNKLTPPSEVLAGMMKPRSRSLGEHARANSGPVKLLISSPWIHRSADWRGNVLLGTRVP